MSMIVATGSDKRSTFQPAIVGRALLGLLFAVLIGRALLFAAAAVGAVHYPYELD